MNGSVAIKPNYTEDEVWDLLTQYLVKHHHANPDSVQRGIYADFHREGSIILVDESEDEFAQLFVYRNLNYNISGNINYPLDTQYSEEFTLQSICEFLEQPFPKIIDDIQLSEEDIAERDANLKIAQELRINKLNRDEQEKRIRYAAISLLYAFEYTRADPSITHGISLHQLTKSVDESNFVLNNKLKHTNDIRIINPLHPTSEEFEDFCLLNPETLNYYGVDKNEIINVAKYILTNNYDNFFSEPARNVGSLLYPMFSLEGDIVSALNVIDIRHSNTNTEFLLIKNEANTIGSVQFKDSEDVEDIIVVTDRVTTADLLKTLLPEFTVHAALSPKNLIQLLLNISYKYPESKIIAVLDNEYSKLLDNKNSNDFKKSCLSALCLYMSENIEDLTSLGVMYPEIDLEQPSSLISLHDVYTMQGEHRARALLDNMLDQYTNRIDQDEHELTHLVNMHNTYAKTLKDKHKVSCPKLFEREENASIDDEIYIASPSNTLSSIERIKDIIETIESIQSPDNPKDFFYRMGDFTQNCHAMEHDDYEQTLRNSKYQGHFGDEVF